MNIREAADALGLYRGTLIGQIAKGKLHAEKIDGIFHVTPDEVERYRRESRRPPALPLAERFWARVNRDNPNGCWEWQGARYRADYGCVVVNGRNEYAHRVSLMLVGRPLKPGEIACHHCDNKPCVNPDHLYAGTQTSNRLDAYRRGQRSAEAVSTFFTAYWAAHPERHAQRAKTHCKRGHPFDAANTHMTTRGGRVCRTCAREGQRRGGHAGTAVT